MSAYGPGEQPPGPPRPQPSPPPAPAFDAKSVSPLDWGILTSAVLSLIFSLFSYYTYQVDVSAFAKLVGASVQDVRSRCSSSSSTALQSVCTAINDGKDYGAWHGFFGWFGVLLAMIGAGLVATTLFAPQVRLPLPPRLAALGAFAVASVSTLLAFVVIPDADSGGTAALGSTSYSDLVNESHGFSYWVVLVLVVVGLVSSFLRFQQTGGQLPTRRVAAPTPPPPPPPQ